MRYVTAATSGATDPKTAIEIKLPQVPGQVLGDVTVYLDGIKAGSSDYRTIGNLLKVKVGTTVSEVKVAYSQQVPNQPPLLVNDSYSTISNTVLTQPAPGILGNDTDPEGSNLTAELASGPSHGTLTLNGDGSFTYTPSTNYVGGDSFTYTANDGNANSNVASVSITVTSTGNVLFSDDFTRAPGAPDPLSPWSSVMGTWTVPDGVLRGLGSASSVYGYAYMAPAPLWGNYSVEGRIRFPAGALGGGLGGRVNPSTGAHYGAWIYPDGSEGGSNVLKLVKFRNWTSWNGVPMAQASLPSVGTDWHTLKMVFNSNRVQVYYDGSSMIDITDNNYDSRAPYLTGGVSVDLATVPGSAGTYEMETDDVKVTQ
jgi:VCBS repeat-containing protein